jgi:hypothetical protein
MDRLLPVLVLACPLGMVAMMLWMHRGKRGGRDE